MYSKPLTANRFSKLIFIAALILFSMQANAQHIEAAGPQYARSSFHQWLWGKHYRKEWKTPVNAPLFYLDTAAGGLTPYQGGGGRQSKTLRLHDRNGREYVIRSIDKTFGGALPPVYQNTFVEKIVNDQVSLGHPYAAVTIPLMSEAAKVYHTNPRIVFIPEQPALDSFNKEYGNRLYLFEQRPDENWEVASNFGNSKNIVSTEKMLEKIQEDNDNRIDQFVYVRARLFDMLIGDGSRHEDQWRWGSFKEDGKVIYKAIPRDRDQAYAKFDGWLLRTILYMANINHLQTFNSTIHNVRTNNFPARNLDRQAANEPTLDQWVSIAKELQSSITDEVIEKSIKELPPEVFPISGNEIINKLRSRRDHLEEYARDYYTFLAKHVEIVGSKENELFQVTRLPDGSTAVTVSRIIGSDIEATPFYSRVFHRKETKEIRLYGLSGNDRYELAGKSKEGITVLIVGGADKDSIVDRSFVKGAERKTLIYDDHDNSIVTSKETRLHLSGDSAVHAYKYDGFKYNYERLRPIIFYSFEDKIYIGLGLTLMRHGWRKEPFKSRQSFSVNYSIMQKAVSFTYQNVFTEIFGKWGLYSEANYDLMRWTNFFGLGNESKNDVKTLNNYQVESRNALAMVGLHHPVGKLADFSFGPLYNMTEILEVKGRYLFQSALSHPDLYRQKHYAGGFAGFSYTNVNNRIVPTKGIYFSLGAQYQQNLEESSRHVATYKANLQLYVPLLKYLSLAIRPSAATLTGKPEFFQYIAIGGSNNLRGYERDRFYGTSSFYSDNELQYLFIHGRYGITGFYDLGRVWIKGETSTTLHTGYGGGIVVAPFYKIMASLTYGVSTEGGYIHIRLSSKL